MSLPQCKRMEPHKFLRLSVCLSLLIGSVSDASSSVRHITCNAGIYAPGDTATVVCNLHADMTANKLSLTISRYALSDVKDSGTDIVVCKWTESTNKHDCETKKGYTFTDAIADHPEVKIPFVNESFAGLYMCANLPPGGTKSHACEIVVQAGQHPTSVLPNEGAGQHPTSVLPNEGDHTCNYGFLAIPIIILLLVVFGVMAWRFYERRAHGHNRDEQPGVLYVQQNQQEDLESLQMPLSTNSEIEELLKDFYLSEETLENVVRCVENYIHDRRSKQAEEATVRITPEGARSLTTETGKDGILVASLTSTVLTIVLVNREAHEKKEEKSKTYTIPKHIKCQRRIQLFEFIAEAIDNFATTHLHGKKLYLWFIVAFPCQNDSLTKVKLKRWTKECDWEGVVNEDFGDLLKKELKKTKEGLDVEIKVIVNDTVATLVSAARIDADCKFALYISDGFNVCFLEESGEWLRGNAGKETVIFNTELGSLGENGRLDELKTDFDKDVDNHSVHPGEQVMEKMIGSMYTTKIVKLVLRRLVEKGLLFRSPPTDCILFRSQSDLPADFVPLVEGDTHDNFFNTKHVLEKLNIVNYTKEDCKLLQLVCRLVSERAADLVACALAGLIGNMKLKSKVTVMADGWLYQNHRLFRKRLHARLKKVTSTEVQIVTSFSGIDKVNAITDAVLELTSRKWEESFPC